MRYLFLFLSTLFITGQSIAQTRADSTHNPKVKINVNIERDLNGNIIRYDSSYTKTWSSTGQNLSLDSIFGTMHQDFDFDSWDNFQELNSFFSFPNNFQTNNFFNDSLFMKSFNAFPNDEDLEKKMLERMQALHNFYFPHKSNQQSIDSTEFFIN